MIDLIFFGLGVVTVFAVFFFSPKPEEIPETEKCPPHKWNIKKVYDDDGVTVDHEYLVCEKCGPMHGVEDV